MTEIKAKDGSKCYVSPILDCFNSEIISVAISRSPNWKQVETMLQQAIEKLPKNAEPILHSDQGWQRSFLWGFLKKSAVIFNDL
ncbi:hypothetical protein IHV77_04215 [Rodentibacter haemolyticus]|uniref:Integrase catalytic domain-containing protein n=1 Tax=Rodentibacter haemolyticus TaxID=2778911 RepID=A0ABX6V1Q5_9PAST|nr:hypothetical protein IHV77_04215 [Rodentibacter haemolyticus]